MLFFSLDWNFIRLPREIINIDNEYLVLKMLRILPLEN